MLAAQQLEVGNHVSVIWKLMESSSLMEVVAVVMIAEDISQVWDPGILMFCHDSQSMWCLKYANM